MLTAKTDTVDVVLGLESGADDYVMKPFKPKELVARMRARLRQHDDIAGEPLTIGPPDSPVDIDVPGPPGHRADGEPIALTPLEFDLLVALARKPRQVFTREVLLEQVWGYRHAADTRLVNVHVQRLRAKVERDPETPRGRADRPRRRLQGRPAVSTPVPRDRVRRVARTGRDAARRDVAAALGALRGRAAARRRGALAAAAGGRHDRRRHRRRRADHRAVPRRRGQRRRPARQAQRGRSARPSIGLQTASNAVWPASTPA